MIFLMVGESSGRISISRLQITWVVCNRLSYFDAAIEEGQLLTTCFSVLNGTFFG